MLETKDTEDEKSEKLAFFRDTFRNCISDNPRSTTNHLNHQGYDSEPAFLVCAIVYRLLRFITLLFITWLFITWQFIFLGLAF